VPVIGSDIGAQGEIVETGTTGFIVAAANPQALAAAMADMLLRGAQGRKAMGEAAQARVCERFTTSALQKATLDVYDRLIGRPA
jgi:glycosyltransferase involved in cell wall biosynthesis